MKNLLSFFALSMLTIVATAQEKVATNGPSKAEFRLAVDEPTEGFTEAVFEKGEEKIYISKEVALTSDHVSYTQVIGFRRDGKFDPTLEVAFTAEGAKRIHAITKANIGRRLAVLVNGKIVSAPTIRSEIKDKTVISGKFTATEINELATIIAPPKFDVRMLLIKNDWSSEDGSKTIDSDLRKALDGSAIPKNLLDQLPAAGPQVLFPRQIVSLYTAEHYADLLAWLKERDLFVDEVPFPVAQFMPQGPAMFSGDPVAPLFQTTLKRPAEFCIPKENLGRYFSFELVPKPFVKRKPVFIWHMSESQYLDKRHFSFTRSSELQEDKRGNESDTVMSVDETSFRCLLPGDHIAIMNAFASDEERGYLSGAAAKGFLPLVVSIPTSAAVVNGKPQVRPPDIIETFKPNYSQAEMPGASGKVTGYSIPPDNARDFGSVEKPVRVQVIGLVKKPGNYELDGTKETRLLDALAMAGGLEENASDQVLIIRTSENGTARVLFKVELNKAKAAEVYNVPVISGDVITVEPKSQSADDDQLALPEQIEEYREAYETSDRNAKETAAKLRDTKRKLGDDAPATRTYEKRLRHYVAEAFRNRQLLHRAELAVMRQKLEKASEKIDTRDQLEEQIVDRRIEDLLNPNVKWDTNAAAKSKPKPKSKPLRKISNSPKIEPTGAEIQTRVAEFVVIKLSPETTKSIDLKTIQTILRSDFLLKAAIKDFELDQLSCMALQNEPIVWLRDVVVVNKMRDESITLSVPDTPKFRDELMKILSAIQKSYENFIVNTTRGATNQVIEMLDVECKEIEQQLADAQNELLRLKDDAKATPVQIETAEASVDRLSKLHAVLLNRIAELDIND